MKEGDGTVLMHERACFNNGTETARFVTTNSRDVYQERNTVQKYASMRSTQKEPEKNAQEKEVFNLTVEPFGVYYANGILVSNCDTLYDAIKIALIDKTLVLDTKQDTMKAATILQKQKSILRTRSSVYGGNQ